MTAGVHRLLRIGRNVADLDRTTAFYCDGLGFHVDDAAANAMPVWTRLPDTCAAPPRVARLLLGSQQIELTEFRDSAPYPQARTSADLGFQHCAVVVNDMREAHSCVMRHGATSITRDGPQTLPPSSGRVTAFKFRDPDGHPLELIEFPPGTGDPRWQSADTDRPTLGIDHSAISVADTERSIRFYELLGLHVAARGVNSGVEQERLDDLPTVEVDVTAMHGARRTPHLELLGYRHPRGRVNRTAALTAIGADRQVWQTGDVGMLLDALDAAGFSDTVVASGRVDRVTVALLRDPDGYALVLHDGGTPA